MKIYKRLIINFVGAALGLLFSATAMAECIISNGSSQNGNSNIYTNQATIINCLSGLNLAISQVSASNVNDTKTNSDNVLVNQSNPTAVNNANESNNINTSPSPQTSHGTTNLNPSGNTPTPAGGSPQTTPGGNTPTPAGGSPQTIPGGNTPTPAGGSPQTTPGGNTPTHSGGAINHSGNAGSHSRWRHGGYPYGYRTPRGYHSGWRHDGYPYGYRTPGWGYHSGWRHEGYPYGYRSHGWDGNWEHQEAQSSFGIANHPNELAQEVTYQKRPQTHSLHNHHHTVEHGKEDRAQ